jgi:hypothetical protein
MKSAALKNSGTGSGCLSLFIMTTEEPPKPAAPEPVTPFVRGSLPACSLSRPCAMLMQVVGSLDLARIRSSLGRSELPSSTNVLFGGCHVVPSSCCHNPACPTGTCSTTCKIHFFNMCDVPSPIIGGHSLLPSQGSPQYSQRIHCNARSAPQRCLIRWHSIRPPPPTHTHAWQARLWDAAYDGSVLNVRAALAAGADVNGVSKVRQAAGRWSVPRGRRRFRE